MLPEIAHQNEAIQENLKLIRKHMKGDINFSLNEKNKKLTKDLNRCCRLMDSSTEIFGLILPVFLRTLADMFFCYTAVFSVVTTL